MPTYTFTNTSSGNTWSELMTISEMEELLEKNPHIKLEISAPALVGDHITAASKVPQGFRQVLKKIKKQNRGSTIDSGNLGEV